MSDVKAAGYTQKKAKTQQPVEKLPPSAAQAKATRGSGSDATGPAPAATPEPARALTRETADLLRQVAREVAAPEEALLASERIAREQLSQNTCAVCRGRVKVVGDANICEECGYATERQLDTAAAATAKRVPQARLKVVGRGRQYFQPDLDRCSVTDSKQSQKTQLHSEILKLRQQAIDRNPDSRVIPLNVCSAAAENMAAIVSCRTTRSKKKKQVLAHTLCVSGIAEGVLLSRKTVAEFVGLSTKGIARGSNFIRAIAAENGGLEGLVAEDTSGPHIAAAFTQLGMSDKKYDHLRTAVKRVIEIAKENHIGTSSYMSSKVPAATFEVLTRYQKKAGIAPMGAAAFVRACQIRQATLERFLGELKKCHSRFKSAYVSAGIYAD